MPFQSTCNSHTGIMWFAFQRRQTTSKYPYNFITAVQNKIKAAVMNSTAFNSRRKGVNREYKACSDVFKGYSNKSMKTDSDSRKNFKCTDLLCTAVSETKTQKVLSNKLARQMKTKRRKSKQLNFECLMKLLKVREKLLIDRTIYLFSLFELQKERLKSKGYMKQYMKVNKKQERLLYQMREERQYLKGLLDLNGRNQRLFPVKALGRLSNQSIERVSSTKQELCRTQNIPIFPGTFYQEYYSKRLLNLTTGSNIYYFDSKCNLFILSKGWNPLGYPVNYRANLIELSRPYIKQNLFDQLKIHETRNNNLPMIQADSNIKYENIVANRNEALELPLNKSYLKEFNETWNTICGKQETAMEDFTYFKKFLEELFNEDSAEISSCKQSNILHLKNEDWPLKSVFAARMMKILIDKINIKTKNLDQLSVCEILKSHLSCVLGAIKLLSNDLFEFVLSVDNVHFYECLIMDLTFETIREYWEFPQEDATQTGCSLQLSKTLRSLLGRHLSQPRNQNVNIHTIDKFKMENSCDYLDNNVINEMYKSDVSWASYQYKEPELLKILIDELVILHLNEIIQCVISERIKH